MDKGAKSITGTSRASGHRMPIVCFCLMVIVLALTALFRLFVVDSDEKKVMVDAAQAEIEAAMHSEPTDRYGSMDPLAYFSPRVGNSGSVVSRATGIKVIASKIEGDLGEIAVYAEHESYHEDGVTIMNPDWPTLRMQKIGDKWTISKVETVP